MDKEEIKFLRLKEYKVIKELSRGGFGETILIEDEIINEQFVCKKYVPYDSRLKENYFRNFVQEIKLLHLLYHKNVVRVFNYYLYPDKITGYILMEYIDGTSITEYLKQHPEKINDVFIQTIDGFKHLQEAKILHRDIRPQNILVTNNGIVKVIDLGFGKQIEFENESYNKSISLNWFYSTPSEFVNKTYDFKTEIYFVGKLFEDIIHTNQISSFAYDNILVKMISHDYSNRIKSFFDVERDIISNISSTIDFSYDEKIIYRNFAEQLIQSYSIIYTGTEYVSDLDVITSRLEDVYNASLLEDILQNNKLIAGAFLKGGYQLFSKKHFIVSNIKAFMLFFKSQSTDKKRLILNNLWQRLDGIKRVDRTFYDLPF